MNAPLHALACVASAAMLAVTGAAATPTPASTPIDDADATAFTLSGDAQRQATFERIDADGPGFSRAIRVSVPDGLEHPWSVGLHHTPDASIAAGDTLLATFSVRCLESMTGEGRVQFDYELSSEPYDKAVSQVVFAPADWKTFHIPFTATRGFATGESHAAFQLALGRQAIELGGFRLENFGPGVGVDDLPRTRQTWAGADPDAPWRAEAAARIDRLRKADLTVEVLDAAGEPVVGASVHAGMTRHGFPFGTAVTSELLTTPTPEGEAYRAIVGRLFNEVVFENDLKWNPHNQGSPEAIAASLDWLDARGITARGHVLVWPSWMYAPEAIETLQDDPDALRAAIAERIRSTAALWRGRLVDWDVVNETYTNHQFQDVLGEESVATWFEIAKEADPEAVLYLNDYGILTAGPTDSPHQRGYFEQIQRLVDAGAPIEGIGLQGHFSAQLTGPERLLEITDRFASFGLPIKVTEFDITTNDPAVQAGYLRDFYTAMFSHEAVEGILMWGFWSGRHWRPDAALYDENFDARPHGAAYERLVLGAWWTDETATTDASGRATVRGFHGDHVVSVEHGGRRVTAAASLDAGGARLTVRLP